MYGSIVYFTQMWRIAIIKLLKILDRCLVKQSYRIVNFKLPQNGDAGGVIQKKIIVSPL